MASILSVKGNILTPRVIQNYATRIRHHQNVNVVKSYLNLLCELGFLRVKSARGRGCRLYYIKTPPQDITTSYEEVGMTYEKYFTSYHKENHKELKNIEKIEFEQGSNRMMPQ